MDFHTLYEKNAAAVRSYALSLCRDSAAADEITADVFFRAWTQHSEIREETLRAYLFTIARNLFRDRKRAERWRVPLDDGMEDPASAVERRVAASSELRRVLDLLDHLPEIERAALLLRCSENLPYEAIGTALGISSGAAKVRVHRARMKLAQALKPVPQEVNHGG
jgi:RNA polymerase sigma-70 factor (ECF subfamily)